MIKQRKAVISDEKFYQQILKLINDLKLPFLIGGTFAIREYTGIKRETKDLDLFCKAGDYIKILDAAQKMGYKTEITDARWLAKVLSKTNQQVDLIFSTADGIWQIDDTWFEDTPKTTLLGQKASLISPTDLIWSKIFMQERRHYDGADVNHLILKKSQDINWQKLLTRMELHWELLFSQLILFGYVYPSERFLVPKWLLEELFSRYQSQLNVPPPKEKVCRGTILSKVQYVIDITEWGYQDFNIINYGKKRT